MTLSLILRPLDVLAFRDGRTSGGESKPSALLPLPQTLAGAVTTHLMRTADVDPSQLAARIKGGESFGDACRHVGLDWLASVRCEGPWLARRTKDRRYDVLYACPSNMHRPKSRITAGGRDGLHRLAPRAKGLPGWNAPLPGMSPVWLGGLEETEPVSGWLDPAAIGQWLAGGTPTADRLIRSEELFAVEGRTGVAIAPGRSVAEQGQLHFANFLRLRDDVTFACDVHGVPDSVIGRLGRIFSIPFGGEQRRVAVEVTTLNRAGSPDIKRGAPATIVLTTPGIFGSDRALPPWVPSRLRSSLAAAVVHGEVAVSGWDLARAGPKPTRFAVPAGTVFWLKDTNALSEMTAISDASEDARVGWGSYLTGVWNG